MVAAPFFWSRGVSEIEEHSPFDFAQGRQEWLCHRSKKNRNPGRLGCGSRVECWTENFSGRCGAWARVGALRRGLRRGGRRGLAWPLERLPGPDDARESRRFPLRE